MLFIASTVAGIAAFNAGEWLIHRYVLHGWGKRKGSFWSFHWREHHNACRKNGNIDHDYQRSPFGRHAQGKELLGLIGVGLATVPLVALSPGFVTGVCASVVAYYFCHKKAHSDAEWARRWLPWHYDHHMGPDQDANWCVTFPLVDWIMGTRKRSR